MISMFTSLISPRNSGIPFPFHFRGMEYKYYMESPTNPTLLRYSVAKKGMCMGGWNL